MEVGTIVWEKFRGADENGCFFLQKMGADRASTSTIQEISNRTVPERTPKKPGYLITRSQLTERGPLVRSKHQFLMEMMFDEDVHFA